MNKVFDAEIKKIHDRLISKKNFSFSKYADGEWAAMQKVNVDNGEFTYDPTREQPRQKLIESFTFRDENYFVGISCPCCQGQDFYHMVRASGQDEDHLTFANVFVNSNYNFFKSNLIPEFSTQKVHLVANKKSKIENLPFAVEQFYPIEYDAWVHNCDLVDEIIESRVQDKLFLFCAGPFGNILAHRLWEANKGNTYLDIGSTLNPWLESAGFMRGYLRGADTTSKVCFWGS